MCFSFYYIYAPFFLFHVRLGILGNGLLNEASLFSSPYFFEREMYEKLENAVMISQFGFKVVTDTCMYIHYMDIS